MRYEFHPGEREVQRRAGVHDIAKRLVASIHDVVPPLARAFLEERHFVVLASTDASDRPWASVLAGPAGFARTKGGNTIRIDATPAHGDPLATNLRTSPFLGLLAIDLQTRRRLRVNGRLNSSAGGAILIEVDQAYSNCPKYIQRREGEQEAKRPVGGAVRRSASLLPHQRNWISRADTFFIATLNPGEGADASHRGGMPGFVKVEDNELVWPDYNGNSMFNTLGNLARYPRAGILVPDFNTGSTLQLTGRATIDWDPGRAAAIPGAERIVRFAIEAIVEIADALPVFRLLDYSPFNPDDHANKGGEDDNGISQ